MSKDEILKILNMPAGRELDALVAERVMGWRYEGGVWYYNSTEGLLSLPTYSTNIYWAWQVVEKTKAKNNISLSWVERNGEWVWEYKIGRLLSATADTAPLAICRAELLVLLT